MVIILGLGFTGERLAKRLLRGGRKVSAAVRGVKRFRELANMGLQLTEWMPDHPEIMLLPRQATLAVLIPPLPEPENAALHGTIQTLDPRRVVYVSSTGVYGDQINIDEATPAEPNDDRGRLRLEEERWIACGPWTSLILRAAAIYGPGRGVQAALREGKLPRGAGSGIVSRIHVEDLAAIVEAGVFSELQGVWPVADDMPCSSAEIAKWCAKKLDLKVPATQAIAPGRQTGGRRVNGRKIREILGVELEYPAWQAGMEASLLEEMSKQVLKRPELR